MKLPCSKSVALLMPFATSSNQLKNSRGVSYNSEKITSISGICRYSNWLTSHLISSPDMLSTLTWQSCSIVVSIKQRKKR